MKKIFYLIKYCIYSILYLIYPKRTYNILNDEETIDLIIKEKKSISRFGDGELKWIMNIQQDSFQKCDAELSNNLKRVLLDEDNNRNCIIGLHQALNKVSEYNLEARYYWKSVIVKYNNKLKKLIPLKKYGSANFTRPYMDYKEKKYDEINQRFLNVKKIWNKKDIVIIEGKKTKLGVGNDLFDNCSSIRRILCPSKNAYQKYDEILEIAKKYKDSTIILALGPTATILAYDLSKIGIQAIDIGHIDLEYMWFINKCTKKEKIPGKAVNEVKSSEDIEDDKQDIEYNNQIIKKIGD